MLSVRGKAYVFQMEVQPAAGLHYIFCFCFFFVFISISFPLVVKVIIRAKHKRYSIAEVPIVFVDRLYGESKLGASEIIAYLK